MLPLVGVGKIASIKMITPKPPIQFNKLFQIVIEVELDFIMVHPVVVIAEDDSKMAFENEIIFAFCSQKGSAPQKVLTIHKDDVVMKISLEFILISSLLLNAVIKNMLIKKHINELFMNAWSIFGMLQKSSIKLGISVYMPKNAKFRPHKYIV